MIDKNIIIELSIDEMAKEIINMCSDQQAELLNELGERTKRHKLDLHSQLLYIRDGLTNDGRWFLEQIFDYMQTAKDQD